MQLLPEITVSLDGESSQRNDALPSPLALIEYVPYVTVLWVRLKSFRSVNTHAPALAGYMKAASAAIPIRNRIRYRAAARILVTGNRDS